MNTETLFSAAMHKKASGKVATSHDGGRTRWAEMSSWMLR